MKNYRGRILMGIVALAATMVVGCKDANGDIGSNFLPDGQSTEMGAVDFRGYKSGSEDLADRVFSTKLYRSDRISAVNQSRGLVGLERDEVFAERRSSILTQYTPGYPLEEDGFGYEPFVDSVMLFLNIKDFSGDTTVMQSYNVYEVVDDSFLRNSKDSLFNAKDGYPDGALGSTPIFTFDFPDQANDVYVTSPYVKVNIEAAGRKLLDRLMLKKGDDGSQATYKYYNDKYEYDDFVKMFKGICIVPVGDLASAAGNDGATYSMELSDAGFMFYGRSRYEADPSIIADTIAMSYIFRDQYLDGVGGVSINRVERDYTAGEIDINDVSTAETSVDATTSTIRVEGMGGVVTELRLEKALFEEFDRLIAEADDDYKTVFFNVAKLMLYIDGVAKYDDPLSLDQNGADAMMTIPTRLGLYDTYSTFKDASGDGELRTVADYDYYSEAMYGATSSIDGYFNRSLGCYVMNIPFEMQQRWSDYVDAKAAVGGDASKIDWENEAWTKLYIAPVADDLFTPRNISLQGEADGVNTTPVRLNVTYTLLK